MLEVASQPIPVAKPRRRYTVTAKVLAANRRNLVKANAVPKEMRYRPTTKRLAACHRNLPKAQAVRSSANAARQPDSRGPIRQALHPSRKLLTEFDDRLRQVRWYS
jgi:hypothetical protein